MEVLNGPLSEKLNPGMIEVKKGEYLRQMKCWNETINYMEELLVINPDQWSNYVNYFDALFEIAHEKPEVIDRAKAFLLSLLNKERSKSTNHLRGPYLAMLYFWQQLHRREYDAFTVFGKHLSILFEYIIRSS